MRKTTIRLSERTLEYIEGAAVREGVSVAQYMREAALARAAYEAAERGGGIGAMMERNALELHKLFEELRAEAGR